MNEIEIGFIKQAARRVNLMNLYTWGRNATTKGADKVQKAMHSAKIPQSAIKKTQDVSVHTQNKLKNMTSRSDWLKALAED